MPPTLTEAPVLSVPSAKPSPRLWRDGWPWLVALIPWAILINYLRLEWSANEQYGYGFVVPLLSLYLLLPLWPTRPEPRPLTGTIWLPVLIGGLAAIFLPVLLLMEASPEWRLIGWVAAVLTTGITAGLVLQRGGRPWLRHFAFPLFFIFAAVPWPTSMEMKVMLPLMQADAAVAVEILNWSGIPAVQQQNVIQLPNGLVGVDEACSGIRSLQTSLMIALFVGEWLQLRLVRRLVLLVAALFLTYLFNLVRTLILVSISVEWGAPVLRRWHDTVGLGILSLSLVGLWALALFIREKNAPANAPVVSRSRPAALWPGRLLAGLGIWLLVAIVGTQAWFDWHEARMVPAVRWNVEWPKNLPTYEPVEIPVEARTSFLYATDESSAAKWQDVGSPSLWLGYFLRWKPGRETSILASTHHPDVCLPATGKPLVANYGTSLFSAAGITLPVQVYQFNDGGQSLFVFYCVWTDGHAADFTPSKDGKEGIQKTGVLASLVRVLLPFTPVSELDYRLRAIAEGRRNQGQQVLELGLWGSSGVEAAKSAFAAELPQLVTRVP